MPKPKIKTKNKIEPKNDYDITVDVASLSSPSALSTQEDTLKYADNGFSLIELIVAVLIMGIVSSIAVVGVSAAQSSAVNTVVQSDLRNSSQSLERYYLEYGRYPSASPIPLGEHLVMSKESYASSGDQFNLFYCTTRDRQEYAIYARGAKNSDRFAKSSLYGLETGSAIPSSNRPFCTKYLDTEYHVYDDGSRSYQVLWARSNGEWNY